MRWFVPLVLLVACDPPGVAVGVPRLEAPAAVVFEAVAFGETTSAEILLHNAGAADAAVTLSEADPFVVADRSATIAAGDDVRLLVLFTPTSYEAVSAELTVRTAFESLPIPITADVDPDLDDDGALALAAGGDDCDDEDAGVYVGADEVCDGVDQDCDGLVDDEPTDPRSWWPDADDDGWGAGDPVLACQAPPDHASRSGDCDDARASVNPGADETWYDGVDQDCSGGSDHDADGDGYDNAGTGGDDCVDSNGSIHPGAEESWYDGIDEDCAGDDDFDADHDGVRRDDDCDDTDETVFPGATEIPGDGVDQDCDGAD